MKKNNSSTVANIVSLIAGAFLMINLKIHFIDTFWDYFFATLVVILNAIEIFKHFKKSDIN